MGKQIVLLQALAVTPAALASLATGSEDGAKTPALAVTAAQMADVERKTLRQLQRVVTEDVPLLKPIVAQAAVDEATSAPQAINAFRQARAQTVAYLMALHVVAWQRRAILANGERITLRALVHRLVARDAATLQALLSDGAAKKQEAEERQGSQRTTRRALQRGES